MFNRRKAPQINESTLQSMLVHNASNFMQCFNNDLNDIAELNSAIYYAQNVKNQLTDLNMASYNFQSVKFSFTESNNLTIESIL